MQCQSLSTDLLITLILFSLLHICLLIGSHLLIRCAFVALLLYLEWIIKKKYIDSLFLFSLFQITLLLFFFLFFYLSSLFVSHCSFYSFPFLSSLLCRLPFLSSHMKPLTTSLASHRPSPTQETFTDLPKWHFVINYLPLLLFLTTNALVGSCGDGRLY